MARRGEITSKSPENLSDHFLNSAFARLAYYFYGCWGGREERAFVPRSGREGEGNAGRSISNMLINDPFERWIGGVGVPTVSFYPFVRQAFECQKEWFRWLFQPSPFQPLGKITSVCVLRAEIFQVESKISSRGNSSNSAGFVRVDRIQRLLLWVLHRSPSLLQDAGMLLVNVWIFSRERMNLMIFVE